MFPGMDERAMKQAMKRLGMKQEEIAAAEVIIKLQNGNELLIANPQVTKVNLMGQDTFQIVGQVSERQQQQPLFTQEDIATVAEQAGVTREKAEEALEKSKGDLAEAIMSLKSG